MSTCGFSSSFSLTARPSRSDSPSEVPGTADMWTTKWLSRSSGRNVPPRNGTAAPAAAVSPAATPDEEPWPGHRPLEQSPVGRARPCEYRGLVRSQATAAEEQVEQRRRRGEGDDQGGEHGRDLGEGERREQPPLEARKTHHRKEDKHDDVGGVDHRTSHVERGIPHHS